MAKRKEITVTFHFPPPSPDDAARRKEVVEKIVELSRRVSREERARGDKFIATK